MPSSRWLAAPLALALAACQQTETPERMQARIDQESATFRAHLDSLAPKIAAWGSGGHADSIASFYTENAVLMPANQPMVVGRDSIRAKFAQWFSWGQWTYTATVQSAVANGPLGIDRGTYRLSLTPGPNAPPGMTAMEDTGKYLVHWHKVDGRWLIAEDISNSDQPMMPAPAPTRRRS